MGKIRGSFAYQHKECFLACLLSYSSKSVKFHDLKTSPVAAAKLRMHKTSRWVIVDFFEFSKYSGYCTFYRWGGQFYNFWRSFFGILCTKNY